MSVDLCFNLVPQNIRTNSFYFTLTCVWLKKPFKDVFVMLEYPIFAVISTLLHEVTIKLVL